MIIGSRKEEGTIEKAGIEAIKGRQRGIPKALPDIDSALHLHPTATIKALPRIATRREDNDLVLEIFNNVRTKFIQNFEAKGR